jgi:hypothetical protein
MVNQLDAVSQYYLVFRKGKRLLDASWEGKGVRYLEETPIEVRINGKLVYSRPGGMPDVTEDVTALLNDDARIMLEDGMVKVKMTQSGQPIEHVTHYRFAKRKPTWWTLRLP